MKMRFPVAVLLLLPLITLSAHAQKTPAADDPLYSSVHSGMIPEHEPFKKRIVAPDGVKFVTAELLDDPEEGDIQRIRVTVGGHSFTLKTKGRGAEILWSPDSRYLAVTYTYCCSGFSPYLHLYEVADSGVRDLEVGSTLKKGFGSKIRCDGGTSAQQWALTAAVKWLDSSHLLAAVQVPLVSVCDSMGVFELREISVPNLSITKTYSQLQAKELFGNDLGANLRNAKDNCVRNPKSCWIAAQH
jgi:hypothetical protein